MYNQTYDEYIRSILGYPYSNDMYSNDMYFNDYNENDYFESRNSNLEDLYPDIYKKIYPIVLRSCQSNTNDITAETIENMTDEIYLRVQNLDGVNINVNLKNEVRSKATKNEPLKPTINIVEEKENRESRQINRNIKDIIRILLLRELLGRPGFNPGPRPPFPPRPRPPMRPPCQGLNCYR